MKPRKHEYLIKAWADGAEIEVFNLRTNKWEETANPDWFPDCLYRIKETEVCND